jgi:hypothetical protein
MMKYNIPILTLTLTLTLNNTVHGFRPNSKAAKDGELRIGDQITHIEDIPIGIIIKRSKETGVSLMTITQTENDAENTLEKGAIIERGARRGSMMQTGNYCSYDVTFYKLTLTSLLFYLSFPLLSSPLRFALKAKTTCRVNFIAVIIPIHIRMMKEGIQLARR